MKGSISSNDLVNALTEEKKKLENVVATKTNEINKLHNDQHKVNDYF
jgi:hypothetical protein